MTMVAIHSMNKMTNKAAVKLVLKTSNARLKGKFPEVEARALKDKNKAQKMSFPLLRAQKNLL